tara:strand:- start:2228 stop:2584 length:357 start_codon:yes stop_codon:yes gene_type:complete
MKITKRQLRRIIREACDLGGGEPSHQVQGVDAPADHHSAEVPVPEDYDRVRDFLNQNSDIVDLGIGLVMDMAGTGCERSTAQGIIDHLKDMTQNQGQDDPYKRGLPQSGPIMLDLEPI